MTKEEIITGLNNALHRGEPLQKAMQSFVNAGYPISEVQGAAKEVDQGITGTLHPDMPELPEEKSKEGKAASGKKKFPLGIIILVIVLLILVGSLVATFFFGQEIMQALFGA